MPALKALILVLVQLVLASGIAPGKTISEKLQSLHRWDSHWYSDIASRGYVSPVPPVAQGQESNVTHFPGYPLLIRATAAVTGAEGKWPALLASWLMAWLSWCYVFALFNRWKTPPLRQGLSIMLLAGFPTALFMVAAYSESLFMAAILGFVYWTGRPGAVGWALAALHGSTASATRIAGIVLAFMIPRQWKKPQAWALNGVALSGLLLFFAYCSKKFGMWDIYLVRQRMGWGNEPRLSALALPASYAPRFSNWLDYNSFGKGMNAVLLALLLALTVALAVKYKRRVPLRHVEGLQFLALSLGLFAIFIVTMSANGFHLVARYDYPIWFFAVLGATSLFQDDCYNRRESAAITAILSLCAGGMVWLQCHFLRIFTEGGPVI
jgi:hypothetical protein